MRPRSCRASGFALCGVACAPSSSASRRRSSPSSRSIRDVSVAAAVDVYAARDSVSGTDVAIKILHSHLSEDRDLADRFRREMSVTRGLDHPGIVVGGPIAPDDARRMAIEMCEALHAAHRAGVVHRDLKPHNVFLTARTDCGGLTPRNSERSQPGRIVIGFPTWARQSD